MILSDKTFKMGVANAIEKYDLVNMVRQIFSYLNKEDCLINSDTSESLISGI